MPGYDGTGPAGAGPMTGKGRGYCVMELPDDEKLPEMVSGILPETRKHVSLHPLQNETAGLHIRINQMQSTIIDLERRTEIMKKAERKRVIVNLLILVREQKQ
jgi:hypothetical protein